MVPRRPHVFQRLFCRPMTPLPSDPGCLAVDGKQATVDLDRAPELAEPGGAIRLEDPRLPDRLLLVRGADGQHRCYANHCACGGFRIDPVPGEDRIRCCTLGRSTFDGHGVRVSGPAKKDLTLFPVAVEGRTLRITLG